MLNQNQNHTTAPAVALLPAVTTTHAARIEAAHTRHSRNTAGVWIATPDGIRPPIHCQSAAQLYRTADTAVYLAIRARHQSSGLDLFRQLTNAATADRTHRNITDLATAAIEAERERDTQRAAATFHRARAAAKTIDPASAKAHRKAAKAATKAADKAAARADSYNKLIKTATASDREPLVQAAIIAALTADPTKPAEVFPAMCAAAGREIANIASPNAAQSTRTKVKEITPEEAAETLKAYPNIVIIDPRTGLEIEAPQRIPHNVKGATSQCFDTIEQRERGRKPNRRRVWCRVSHYLTIAPYISYEAFTELSGGDTSEIATNGGINAIGTQEDAAAVADFLSRANLTERESAIIYKVADQTAAKHGQAAANDYWKKRTPEIATIENRKERRKAYRAAQATADRERTAAQWGNAFDRAGIWSESNRRQIKSRIRAKLTEATKPAEPLSQAEQEERTARQWERMQRSPRRGYTARPTAAPDIIGTVCPQAVPVAPVLDFTPGKGWSYRPAKSAAEAAESIQGQPAPVIIWTESGHTPEAVNPGTDYRAAAILTAEAIKGGNATPPALTERERRQWEKLCKSEAETAELWRKFEAATGRTPDTDPAHLTKADTTTAEAQAERERMRAAAAKLSKVNAR